MTMNNFNETSYLREVAREQDKRLKAYEQFEKDMDIIGDLLINPFNKRSSLVDFFLKSKRELNLKKQSK